MFGQDNLVKTHKARVEIIGNITLIAFAVILARLWFLQIYKGEMLYRFSLENRLRKDIVNAPRGMIFSRQNKMLVHNIPRFDAIIIPQYLKDKQSSIKYLSKILNKSEKSIIKLLKKRKGRQAKYVPVEIKKNISRQEVALIESSHSKMPGVSVRTFISREYIDKEVGGHLFGYIAPITKDQLPKYKKRDNRNYRENDFIGQAGIEEHYDLRLRGEDGHEFMEVDASGAMKRHISSNEIFTGIENKNAIPGKNLRLTIDKQLQKIAYDSLEDKVGSVVALDINSGEILAMVSRPSYDPTEFSKGISAEYWNSIITNEHNPLRNRAIQEHYPPGSTFKTITAIAALEEGIIDEETTITCTGKFRLGRRTFHCWKRYGHGVVDIHKAIKESCDVFFYKIATKLDIDVLAKYAKVFGFGRKNDISLPEEITGLIPTKEWKLKKNGEPWQKGETLSCVIGQSYVLVTTLQMATAYATIANGKVRYKPQLIREIFNNNGKIIKKFNPEVVKEIEISDKTLKLVREGLFKVVNEKKGTAWWYRGLGIRMSGKTGTSQVVRMTSEQLFSKCEDVEYKYRNHGLFVGYAPRDNPKIVVATIIEHGCHGSSTAPIVRNVITDYMSRYHPELYKKYYKEDWDKLKKYRSKQAALKKEKENKLIESQSE